MQDNFIDLVVTSPPYDNLRTYGNITDWSFDVFKEIADLLVKKLKEGGVIMWNVQDATIKGSKTGSSFRQALYFMEKGLNLHDTMIYEKTGIAFAAGEKSVRYSQAFEYCFILSKGKPKTVNIIMDKPNKWAGSTSWGNAKSRNKEGELQDSGKKSKEIKPFGARTNIWRIKNSGGFGQKDNNAYKHPATMPMELAKGHIETWSNKGDIVYDPFSGSGTTSKVALEMGRNYIGSEINTEYYKDSIEILNELKNKLKFFDYE
jgi:site-specific DNA-methyltransferase (adenine-specific)